MTQKTPDPAVAHLRPKTLWSDRRSSQITSDLRPTDSRLDTRRSCMDSCPIPAQLFSPRAPVSRARAPPTKYGSRPQLFSSFAAVGRFWRSVGFDAHNNPEFLSPGWEGPRVAVEHCPEIVSKQIWFVSCRVDNGTRGHAPNGTVPYSMNSSAVASNSGGIVSPSVFAVLRLMTSSNLAGSSMGNSLIFAPLRMRPTK
jgi:hypothetical protein